MNHVMGGGLDIWWRRQLVGAVAAQRPRARARPRHRQRRRPAHAHPQGRVFRIRRRRRLLPAHAPGGAGQGRKKNSSSATACTCPSRTQPSTPSPSPGVCATSPTASPACGKCAACCGPAATLRAGIFPPRRVAGAGPTSGTCAASCPSTRSSSRPERGAYEYLGDSILGFPRQPALAALMREAGFSAARWTNLALGIVAVHVADV
ncbi:MAG: class I SAM-dependent methyltransferase [Verrucomicrobiota bacterium]